MSRHHGPTNSRDHEYDYHEPSIRGAALRHRAPKCGQCTGAAGDPVSQSFAKPVSECEPFTVSDREPKPVPESECESVAKPSSDL